MKYRARRDLPRFASKHHTLSPTKLREIILIERNKAVSISAISHWFGDHPQITESLHNEIVGEDKEKLEVSESIFENGTFYELLSIKKWVLKMRGRPVSEIRIKGWIGRLKQVCKGELRSPSKRYGFPEGVYIKDWTLKHPDRLTAMDGLEFIAEM